METKYTEPKYTIDQIIGAIKRAGVRKLELFADGSWKATTWERNWYGQEVIGQSDDSFQLERFIEENKGE